jgi:hypothetical protein
MLLSLSTGAADAQWIPGGTRVPGAYGPGAIASSDGAGGAILVWGENDDVFAQRLTESGYLGPGWPPAGFVVCNTPDWQENPNVVADGDGGAIFVWADYRDAFTSGIHPYALKVTHDGLIAPGWSVNGIPLSSTSVGADTPLLVGDGAGGAIVAWGEASDSAGYAVHAQHVMADGSFASDWPAGGAILRSAYQLSPPYIVADGSGGVLLVWEEDGPQTLVYVQHLTAAGAIADGWPAGGVRVAAGYFLSMAATDGAGGVYVEFGARNPGAPYYAGQSVELQRITAAGQVAPGWPPNGIEICDYWKLRVGQRLGADGMGGVYVEWYETPNLMADHVQADGTLAPGWVLCGNVVTPEGGPGGFSSVLADGNGGGYFVFEKRSPGVQHLTSNGNPAPGWPIGGLALSGLSVDGSVEQATDEAGGTIVTWGSGQLIYAQHVVMDGVVATQISLVSADAAPGVVSLLWQSASAQGLAATVYRRTKPTTWQSLGAPTLDGPDRLRYEDRSVTPGTRYSYRLGYRDGGAEQFTAETWVDVPAPKLALGGARPNPAVRLMNVSLSLPDESPARLAVLDVAGRAVLTRDVGALGAGSHLVPLDLGTSIAPGVYWLRLTQGGHALLARAAVIR